MATNLTITQAQLSVGYTFTNDNALGGKTTDGNVLSWAIPQALSDGSGNLQANKVYAATRTISASANDDIDVAGSLTNAFGSVITFTKIKGILVIHPTTSAASGITLGGGGVNSFVNWVADATDKVKVPNGYSFALLGSDATGFAVTAGTGDILRVTNLDGVNTATYTILLYGA